MALARIAATVLLIACAAQAESIHGRIQEDHTGNPLASVEIRIAKDGQRDLVADIESDTQGRFAGPELAAGDYRVDLSKPNFASAALRVHMPAPGGLGPLAVRLVRLAVISGRVASASGTPVRGARVMVIARPADGAPPRPQRGSTQAPQVQVDAAGNYRLFGLAPGEYLLAATYGASTTSAGSSGNFDAAPGVGSGALYYPNNQQPRWLSISGGEQLQNVDFLVQSVARYHVSGRVVLPDSKANAWLALLPVEQPSLAMAIAETKQEGVFQFEGISPGSYYLTAAGPSRARNGLGALLEPDPFFGRIRVNITADNVEGLSVPVQKSPQLSVILKPSGSACPSSATVTLSGIEDWGARLEQTLEASAAKPQTVTNLAPSRYLVSASRLGSGCQQSSPIVLDLASGAPSEPVAIAIAPAGGIRGRLVGNRNPAGYTVTLIATEGDENDPRILMALPDAEGAFTFGSLRPGKYSIAAQPQGETGSRWVADLSRMFQVDVPAGQPLDMELPVPVQQGGKQ